MFGVKTVPLLAELLANREFTGWRAHRAFRRDENERACVSRKIPNDAPEFNGPLQSRKPRLVNGQYIYS
jgi:hypothetical protein